MAQHNLPLRADPRTVAWKTVADRIASHPDLAGLWIDWRYPDNPDWADAPAETRVTVQFEPLMDRPVPFAAIGWGRVVYQQDVRLRVRLSVPGDLFDDWPNLWGAIERAALGRGLQPGLKAALDRENQALGITNVEVTAAPNPGGEPGEIVITTYSEG